MSVEDGRFKYHINGPITVDTVKQSFRPSGFHPRGFHPRGFHPDPRGIDPMGHSFHVVSS